MPETIEYSTHNTAIIPVGVLAELSAQIENGLYLKAYELTKPYGPLKNWTGTTTRILAGRLACYLGASRLGHTHNILAWRQDRTSCDALYHYANTLLTRQGPFSVWKLLSKYQEWPQSSPQQQASLLTVWARLYSQTRDFVRATDNIKLAVTLDPENPWVWVVRSWVYEEADQYSEALTAAQHALDLQPWYRPAVSQASHLLTLSNRIPEALELLHQGTLKLESAEITGRYAELLLEQGDYASAQKNFENCLNLSPLAEPNTQSYWLARVTDAAYKAGAISQAVGYAQDLINNNNGHKQLAQGILDLNSEGKRISLPVEFIRQHHMTCVPATLAMLSQYWGQSCGHLEIADEICYSGTPNYRSRAWVEQKGWQVREFTITWESTKALIDQGIPFTMSTVEPNSAHMQAVIGYDSALGLLLVRDPYQQEIVEFWAEVTFDTYRAYGPRGMAFVPTEKADVLRSLTLEDTQLYDHLYQIQRLIQQHYRSQAEDICQQLVATAPGHRVSIEALITLAHYDGNQPQLLAHINQMLDLFPDSPNWILHKSFCLEDLAYREERANLLQDMSHRPNSHPVFWQSYAQLLSDDARESKTATRLLKRAIKVMPGDAESYYLLAELFWSERQFEDAVQLYRFATCLEDKKLKYARSYFDAARGLKQTEIALNLLIQRWEQYQTQSSQPAYVLAWAYQHLNQTQDMFAVVRSAQELHPDDGDLILYRARLHASYGDREITARLLEQAKGKTSDLSWLRMAAELAQLQGERSQALDLWQQIVQADPLSFEANQAIATLLTESQGAAAARDFLEQICRQFPHSHFLHALWYEQIDDECLEQAEALLRHIIEQNPVYAWARRQLAWQLGKQNRLEEAFTELVIAESLEPHNAAYFRIQGRLFVLANRVSEAKQAFQTSLGLAIDSEWTIRQLLSLCQSQAERREALTVVYQEMTRQVISGSGLLMYRTEAASVLSAEELLAALRIGLEQRPDLWQAWSVVVQQLCCMELLTEAVALAQQATERFPLQVDSWLELAAVYETQEDVDAELSALQQAVELSPGSSYAVRQLADAYDRSGQLEASRAILEQAIVHAPCDYRNYGYLAENQWQSDQQDAALLTLEKALRLEPDYSWAWSSLRQWSLEREQPQRPVELARELTVDRAGEAANWLRLAELLTEPEQQQEQYAAVAKAIQLNQRSLEAYDLKAKLLTAEQKYEDAIATLKAPIWGETLPTVVQGRLAWIEAQRGNLSTAIELMRATVAQEPDYYWGWSLLVDWYDQIGADVEYREVAVRLTDLEPKDSTAWGYLGDAQLRQGDRAAAKVSFKKALELLPSYRYVGLSLFDLELEDRQLQDAAQTFSLLQTHAPESEYVIARSVQLSALQGHQKQALVSLRMLCLQPTENDWPLHAATKAVIEADWTQAAQRFFQDNLSNSELHPELAACWVRCCIALNQWRECLTVIQQWPLEKPLEQQAAIYLLREAASLDQFSLVNDYLQTSSQVLQAHTETWGIVGYCLYTQGKYKRVIQWLSDWEQREAVDSWMLINLVLALRHLNRSQEAVDVSKKVVKSLEDSSSDCHRVWVAIDAARSGSKIQAARLIESLNVKALQPNYQSLYYLIQALLVFQSAQGSRDSRYRQAREHIQQASKVQPQLWSYAIFRNAFRRTVWWIAIKNLSPQSLLWAYWQCFKPCLASGDRDAWSLEGQLTAVICIGLFLLVRVVLR